MAFWCLHQNGPTPLPAQTTGRHQLQKNQPANWPIHLTEHLGDYLSSAKENINKILYFHNIFKKKTTKKKKKNITDKKIWIQPPPYPSPKKYFKSLKYHSTNRPHWINPPPPPSSISLSLSLSLPTSFGKCPWPVTLTPPDARCGATPQVEYVTGIIIIINQSICQNGRIARAWTRLIHFSAPLQLDLRVAGMCRLLQSGYHLLIEPIPRQLFAHPLPPPTLSPIQKEFFFYWLEFHQIKNKSPWSSFIGQFCRWWVWIASEINQGQVDSSQPNSIIRHQINRILFESVRLP